jgi:UDP-glucose 6-dehydrogenase
MKKKQKILIVGFGRVGRSARDMFARKFQTFVYDPYIDREKYPNIDFVDNLSGSFTLAVICLPTPMDLGRYVALHYKSGYIFKIYGCNTALVEKAVSEINADYFLIKSTLAPGTTEKLIQKTGKKICQSPEYMGESTYHSTYDFHKEMILSPWIVLGGDSEAAERIFDLMQTIVGPQKHFYFVGSAKNAELIKTMENDYFADKIIFANEARTISEKSGGQWFQIREGWGLDPRVNLMHTGVFFEERGYGGKCLPKDTMARVYSIIADYNYYPYASVARLLSNTILRPEEMNNAPIKSLNDIKELEEITVVRGKKEKIINPTIV